LVFLHWVNITHIMNDKYVTNAWYKWANIEILLSTNDNGYFTALKKVILLPEVTLSYFYKWIFHCLPECRCTLWIWWGMWGMSLLSFWFSTVIDTCHSRDTKIFLTYWKDACLVHINWRNSGWVQYTWCFPLCTFTFSMNTSYN
jgi:hypothetical protein